MNVKERLEEQVRRVNLETGEVLADDTRNVDISEAKQLLGELKHFVNEMMTEGLDYGNLPKTDKKCLFKSGAEKLCYLYGLAPLFEVVSQTEDFSQGLFSYQVKVSLKNKENGRIEAEGAGSCNSFESKYTQSNKFNLANTILKMAKKRAFIDATLLATRSSSIFTQDMEDDVAPKTASQSKTSNTSTRVETTDNRSVTQNQNQGQDDAAASDRQLSYISTLLAQKMIPIEQSRAYIRQHYGKADSRYLSRNEASDYIGVLRAS